MGRLMKCVEEAAKSPKAKSLEEEDDSQGLEAPDEGEDLQALQEVGQEVLVILASGRLSAAPNRPDLLVWTMALEAALPTRRCNHRTAAMRFDSAVTCTSIGVGWVIGTTAALPPIPPAEQRLADRLAAQQMPPPMSTRAKVITVLRGYGEVDLAVYQAIAGTPTPPLDRPMRRVSAAANWSRSWIAIGGVMAVAGGRTGRAGGHRRTRGARRRLRRRQIGFKFAARRRRPDRDSAGVAAVRRVPMPASASFPSGHTASGFAFTNAVAHTLPAAAAPLGMLASAVGYPAPSLGVHYPGDVVIGAVIGSAVGEVVGWRIAATARQRGRPDRPVRGGGQLYAAPSPRQPPTHWHTFLISGRATAS